MSPPSKLSKGSPNHVSEGEILARALKAAFCPSRSPAPPSLYRLLLALLQLHAEQPLHPDALPWNVFTPLFPWLVLSPPSFRSLLKCHLLSGASLATPQHFLSHVLCYFSQHLLPPNILCFTYLPYLWSVSSHQNLSCRRAGIRFCHECITND